MDWLDLLAVQGTLKSPLQHQTLLLSPVTSTTGCCFCLGTIPSFFLISPLISSIILGTYWPGEFIFQCPIFLHFQTIHGFSKQEYWSGLPFPSPVDHILSELCTMTRPSWVAPHGMAHSFIELGKAVVHVISLVSFLWLWFSFLSALWWRRTRGLWELPDGRDWLWGNLGLVLMGGAMLSTSLIQISADGWGCEDNYIYLGFSLSHYLAGIGRTKKIIQVQQCT